MPASDVLSPTRFVRLEAHLHGLVESGTLPHVQFLAARDGDALFTFGAGAAREDGRPLPGDAIYRIASMTKAVTAAACLMLVEEGQIALDDPVARHLPELADLAVHVSGTVPPFVTRPATRQPRIIDLLRHTAGFTYGIQTHSPVDQHYWMAGIHNYRARITREGMIEALRALPLVDDPGTRFTYSIATDLLGLILERVLGRSLGDIFEERIFGPLGMVDTGFQVPADKIGRFVDAWAEHPRRGRYLYDPAEAGIWSRPPSFESGGGGLVSTVADYHRFCRMLLGQGALEGARLLKTETVAMMTRNQLPGGASISALSRSLFSGAGHAHVGQGLGLAVTLPGGSGAPPAGEVHWSGLFSTFYSIIPSERLILIFMSQIIRDAGEESLSPEVQRILFAPG